MSYKYIPVIIYVVLVSRGYTLHSISEHGVTLESGTVDKKVLSVF